MLSAGVAFQQQFWPISGSVKRLSRASIPHPTSGFPCGSNRRALSPARGARSAGGTAAGFDPEVRRSRNRQGRSDERCGLEQKARGYLSSSPLEDEPPEDQDGVVPAEGLGEAQLGPAGAGAGAGVGAASGAAGLGAAGLGVAGLAAGAAFFAVAFLADFLADFLAAFLAFFADFFADFLDDFLPDFFFAIISFFLLFLVLPLFFFLPLAIVILLLPPINVYRAFQVVRLNRGANAQFNPGRGPPVAQSRSSTVCTTGTDVPPAICTMHPILPAAIMSGLTFAILATFRSRNLFAMSGWRMLYVPAEPQHKWLSGTSFTTNPLLESNSFGACVIFCPCCSEQAE